MFLLSYPLNHLTFMFLLTTKLGTTDRFKSKEATFTLLCAYSWTVMSIFFFQRCAKLFWNKVLQPPLHLFIKRERILRETNEDPVVLHVQSGT